MEIIAAQCNDNDSSTLSSFIRPTAAEKKTTKNTNLKLIWKRTSTTTATKSKNNKNTTRTGGLIGNVKEFTPQKRNEQYNATQQRAQYTICYCLTRHSRPEAEYHAHIHTVANVITNIHTNIP